VPRVLLSRLQHLPRQRPAIRGERVSTAYHLLPGRTFDFAILQGGCLACILLTLPKRVPYISVHNSAAVEHPRPLWADRRSPAPQPLGDLRSCRWRGRRPRHNIGETYGRPKEHGQETVPQRAALGGMLSRVLWEGSEVRVAPRKHENHYRPSLATKIPKIGYGP
jgi:hypothetical protein